MERAGLPILAFPNAEAWEAARRAAPYVSGRVAQARQGKR